MILLAYTTSLRGEHFHCPVDFGLLWMKRTVCDEFRHIYKGLETHNLVIRCVYILQKNIDRVLAKQVG